MAISDYLKDLRSKVGHQLLQIPSVAAIIRDEMNRILLQKTSEEIWSLPAGAIELGETPVQAIIREVWEETNLIVRPLRVVGVFGGATVFVTHIQTAMRLNTRLFYSNAKKSAANLANATTKHPNSNIFRRKKCRNFQ